MAQTVTKEPKAEMERTEAMETRVKMVSKASRVNKVTKVPKERAQTVLWVQLALMVNPVLRVTKAHPVIMVYLVDRATKVKMVILVTVGMKTMRIM